jgi:hypothetical protein
MMNKGQDCITDSVAWAEGLQAAAAETASGPARVALSAIDRADLFDTLAAEAGKLVSEAQEPLVIGVVGEFSVGKSLLLSALVGLPGLLTVGPTATTGNITRIRITQSPDDNGTPAASAWQALYCSEPEVLGMMGYFHARLVALAEQEKLPPQARASLVAARPGHDWKALAGWCQTATSVQSGPARLLVEEVLRLDEASRRHATLLGRTRELSAAGAEQGMSQPGLRLGQPGADQFPADQLPLVRRLDVTVAVPRSLWRLDGVGDLMLLDFPGLGSTMFGERDRYLCRREVADVHTILALVDASRGPTDTILEFYAMLREPADDGRDQRTDVVLRDSMLLAYARFDELKVDEVQVLDAVERSSDEQDLLARREVAPLKSLVEEASRLSLEDASQTLSLVSSMAWLVALEDARPGVLSQGFKDRVNYGKNQAAARSSVDLWRQVTDRLAQRRRDADGVPSSLEKALAAFTREGGLPYLRERLASHAAAHGGEQRIDAVRRRGQQVDELRRRAVGALRQASKQVPVDVHYEEIHQLIEATREFLYAVQNDMLIDVDAPRPDGDPSLRKLVESEAAYQVSGWSQWRGLFNAVDSGNQLVTFQEDTGQEPDAELIEMLGSELAAEISGGTSLAGVPLMTEDFLEPFRATSDALFGFVEQAAVSDCLEKIDERLHAAGQPGLRWQRVLSADPPAGPATDEERRLATALREFSSADYFRGRLASRAAAERPSADRLDAAYPFESGHGLPWHPESPRADDTRERHVANVARVNRELVKALTYVALTYLAAEVKLLIGELRRTASTGQRVVVRAQDARNFSRAARGDTQSQLAELANNMDSKAAPECLASRFTRVTR